MRKHVAQITLSLVLSTAVSSSFAQGSNVGNTASTAGNEYLQKQNAVDRLAAVNPNTATFGIPLPPASLEGDFYLDSEFKEGSFELTVSPKVYDDMVIRYDLRSNLIEINYDDGVRGLDGNKVKYFDLKTSTNKYKRYVNVNQLKGSGDDMPTNIFLEVILDGAVPLYSYEKITIKKADYNVALNVGNKNDQILKKPVYLSIVDGKAIELTKGKNSNVFSLLPGKENELKAYAKANKIKPKDVEGYVAIINKINSMN